MYDEALVLAEKSAIFISCAAVADYRAETIAKNKIKKTDDSNELVIKLVKNPDIVASIAGLKDRKSVV